MEEKDFNRSRDSCAIPVDLIKETDGTYIAKTPVISDVFAAGTTRDEALDALCLDLIEYAKEYRDNYDLYSKAPNRKAHLPYVLKILSATLSGDARSMLRV